MGKLIGTYKNGNYTVAIFDDGTKIRRTNDDEFIPSFSESIDFKITNYCDAGCAYCHENSTKNGLHGDIMNMKFIDTLHPYTEIAHGGGDPLSHPDLIPFLKKLKSKRVIANITVNQKHFMEKQDFVKSLVDRGLISGLGVSLVDPNKEFIDTLVKYPNAVLHIINGVHSATDLDQLRGKGIKILILGYKVLRRGESFYDSFEDVIENSKLSIKEDLPNLINDFNVVSFDNLAIKQLGIKEFLTDEEWDEFYMGNDGFVTYFIDGVNEEFALSSTSLIRHKLLDSIDDMFEVIRTKK